MTKTELILKSTGASEDIVKNLQFGKAVPNVEYGDRDENHYTVRAGQNVLVERKLHHNKPDIEVPPKDVRARGINPSSPELQNARGENYKHQLSDGE